MAATTQGAIRELLESMQETLTALLELPDEELATASGHICAQERDVWTLITNDIDHEKIHVGQVLEGRYEARLTQSRWERLLAEWLVERARLAGALIGLSDEEFNQPTAPDAWTYRQVAKHVVLLEQDSLRNIREAIAARSATR